MEVVCVGGGEEEVEEAVVVVGSWAAVVEHSLICGEKVEVVIGVLCWLSIKEGEV